jgi:zinc protease
VAEFRDRKQSAIVLAFPTVPMAHPDWVKLRMIQELSSGLSGTLFAELRGKRALAYTVSAAVDAAAQSGLFFAYMASEAAKEELAKKGLLEELRHLGGDAATAENVARTKSSLSGATRINQQTNSARAATLARYAMLGVGLDFTQRYLADAQKVTVDDLRATATKYFGNENFVMTVVKGKP